MDELIRFEDMPYERGDFDALKAELTALTERFSAAKTYEEARLAYLEHARRQAEVMTTYNLCYMRHSIDTRDEFYTQEMDFWDDAQPELMEYEHPFMIAKLQSPFRAQLEAEFGVVDFVNDELQARSFSPEIVPELQQENKLVSEYDRLIASAQIEYEGETYTLAQFAPKRQDEDDARRLEAWKVDGAWYKEHQADLDRIYDGLVRVRTAMAKKLGHESYVPMAYDRMTRNCYGKEDVDRFREAVRAYLVPLATRIYFEQAKRIGVEYPMSYSDMSLKFRSGNPRPQGTADDILEQGKRFYDELSPETSAYFRSMLDRHLMDVLAKPGKEGGGYCDALYVYRAPFIFANFNGTQDDVETVTHEAGHGFAAWLNIDRLPISTVWPSMEGCEVHSMSMEFFAWPWAEGFFGPDTKKFLFTHLAGAITFIPYGCLVDHFQHVVYEHPEYTPAERHAAWRELQGIYMPWVRLDGEIPFYAEGEAWQRQSHIYDVPFYYIDYCLAQTVALEFWAMIQEDRDAAWERYMAYTREGGSRTFTDLLDHAGLVSPFDEACLREVSEKAAKWLEDCDLTGIE